MRRRSLNCSKCGENDWHERPNGKRYCNTCQSRRVKDWEKKNPERRKTLKARWDYRTWASENVLKIRYYSYRSRDRRRKSTTIDFERAVELMKQECHYCKTPVSGGLDRKDSNLGHVESNVVPCCARCNVVLGTLPYSIKLVMRVSLQTAAQLPEWKSWVIPIKKERK